MAHPLNPHKIAQTIRSLDSRLLAIELDENDGQPRLVYRYEVAGRIEPFYIPITTLPVDSIAELYPEALAYEKELSECYGIEFHPYQDGK